MPQADSQPDLATLRLLITGWRRLEHARLGGSRLARHLAIADMSELWRTEVVGWSRDLAEMRGFHPLRAAAP